MAGFLAEYQNNFDPTTPFPTEPLEEHTRNYQKLAMAKRPAEESEDGGVKLKDGERPTAPDNGTENLNYEDEFEDEYESEDEVFEAGVDGRPDNERENEEKRGTWIMPEL